MILPNSGVAKKNWWLLGSIVHTIFAIDSNIFAENDHRLESLLRCRRFYQCARCCRMSDVIRQRHPFLFLINLCNEHFVMGDIQFY